MHRHDFQELSLPQFSVLPRQICMRVEYRPEKSFVAPHRHPWAQFMYCSQGVMSVTAENGNYVLTPEMALWIPPMVEHSVEMVQQIYQESMYVDGDLGAKLAGTGRVVSMTPLVRSLISEAATYPLEYDEAGAQGRLMSVLLDQLAGLSTRDVLLPLPQDVRLQKICRYLIKDPSCSYSLDLWSHRVGASSRTLARLFEQETGMGFRAWRQRLRLQRAMMKLGIEGSVHDLARSVGYTSSSAFITAFKRYFSISPSQVKSRP